MTMQFSVNVRNARVDAIETAIGTTPILRIYDLSGAAPANCAAAISGGTVAELNLPSDWKAAASGGSAVLAGTWQDTSANAAGTADFFRMYASNGTDCHIQGTVTITGSGGDMTLDNTVFAAGQSFTITAFTLADGNA